MAARSTRLPVVDYGRAADFIKGLELDQDRKRDIWLRNMGIAAGLTVGWHAYRRYSATRRP